MMTGVRAIWQQLEARRGLVASSFLPVLLTRLVIVPLYNIFPIRKKIAFCLNDNSHVHHWCYDDLGEDVDVHDIHRDAYSMRCMVL